MKVPIVKGTLAGIISGTISKFYYKEDAKLAVMSGAITLGSVVVTDTLFSLITVLPDWFKFLGTYGQDFASALLDAGVRFFASKYSMKWSHSNGGFIVDFLISLGSTVLASYAEAPLNSYLPDMLKSY
jgi:hypothetical protein